MPSDQSASERFAQMARDRDDVIHEIAQHLRAALAVIDRYEDGIYRLASDEEGK